MAFAAHAVERKFSEELWADVGFRVRGLRVLGILGFWGFRGFWWVRVQAFGVWGLGFEGLGFEVSADM